MRIFHSVKEFLDESNVQKQRLIIGQHFKIGGSSLKLYESSINIDRFRLKMAFWPMNEICGEIDLDTNIGMKRK